MHIILVLKLFQTPSLTAQDKPPVIMSGISEQSLTLTILLKDSLSVYDSLWMFNMATNISNESRNRFPRTFKYCWQTRVLISAEQVARPLFLFQQKTEGGPFVIVVLSKESYID